jgi:DNA gyrase subunit A
MCTRNGIIKKTVLSEYRQYRKNGLLALNLDEGDELIGVHLTDGVREISVVTQKGMSIRFSEKEVRPTGRTARGVKGITLRSGDQVVGVDVVKNDGELLVITENGFGKRTPLTQYRIQSRGGIGIKTLKGTGKNGDIVGMKVVYPEHEVMVITASGIIIRMAVSDISSMGRDTQGVTIMRLGEEDKVVALARVVGKAEEGGE